MKYILIILLLLLLGIGIYAHYHDFAEEDFDRKLIGLCILTFSFIWMPLFIYYRYKNKKKEDFILTRDKLKEMNDFGRKE